jgi:isopentenyl-diphosphate delta-isomerase
MPNGVKENELCPVFTAVASGEVTPDPSEVDTAQWFPWAAFRDEVLAGDREVSAWCAAQVAELAARELADGTFRIADPTDLPAAARHA